MSIISHQLQIGAVGAGNANGATVTGNTLNLQTATSSQPGVVSMLPGSQIRVTTPNGYGSSNTKIRRFSTTLSTVGSDITFADSATLGSTFTINAAGVYAIYRDDGGSAVSNFGISINSSELTTNVQSIADANRLVWSTTVAAKHMSVSVVIRCAVNDVIRAHDDGTLDNSGSANSITIVQLYKF